MKFTPNKEIDRDADPGTIDYFATNLLDEVGDRFEYLRDMQAWFDNAPPASSGEFPTDGAVDFDGLEELQNMSYTSWPSLIVTATTDRLGILGFRTTQAADEAGDKRVAELFKRDSMGIGMQEAMWFACGYRAAYLSIDPATTKQEVIPPTNAAVIPDVFGEPIAAIVLRRDRALGRDVLRLFVREQDPESGAARGRARMFIATREFDGDRRLRRIEVLLTENDNEVPLTRRMGGRWVWWKEVPTKVDRIPVTVLKNKGGVNEFEKHIPHITRINHMIFQRVVIITMQAFKQRAVIGDLPDRNPTTGEPIDYNDMFEASPAALWRLPADTQMWESSSTTFQEILNATQNDIKDLASVTYTPMSYFSDSLNQSSHGADAQRENSISKVQDRRLRFAPKLERHVSILMEMVGDQERAKEDGIEPIWAPIQVQSLTERTAAFGALRGSGAAFTTALREGLGMTPSEISRAVSEALEEKLSNAITTSIGTITPLAKSAQTTTQTSTTADSQSLLAQRQGGVNG